MPNLHTKLEKEAARRTLLVACQTSKVRWRKKIRSRENVLRGGRGDTANWLIVDDRMHRRWLCQSISCTLQK